MDRIKYIYQENAGQANATNRGILASSGKYIAFLDADDVWMPDKLELQVELFEKNPEIGLVFADAEVFQDDGVRAPSFWMSRGFHNELTANPCNVENAFEKLLEVNFIPAASVVVRRECFAAVGLFEESIKLVTDKDMWLRIAKEYKIGCVPKILLRKRGYSTRDYELLKQTVLWVLDKMEVLYPETIATMVTTVNRTRARIHRDLAMHYWYRDDLVKARRECLSSLRCDVTLPMLVTAAATLGGRRGKAVGRWIKHLVRNSV